MKKTLITLALMGLSTSMVQAETVRLVVNTSTKATAENVAQARSFEQANSNNCVNSPSGDATWCLPSRAASKFGLAIEQSTSTKPYYSLEVDAQGYTAQEIAQFMNESGTLPFVEVDHQATTPDYQPYPVPGNVSEQNSDDPQTGHQTRYLGNSDDLTLGMSVFQMWDEVDVRTKDNPVDVIVMDSSFFEASDMVYDDGRSFTTVPLVPGGPEQARNDDFSPRQESIDAGICTGHGLGVAGTIAATIDNGIAGAGVTNNVNVHAIRTMTCGSGFLSDTGDALLWLSGQEFEGVTPYQGNPGIVNLSLSARIDECPTFMQNAIDSVRDAGFTVVVASSNNYADTADFAPANCDGVTVVAALDRDGNRAAFSNVGAEVDFSAAGTDVVAPCDANEDGCFWEGTSFATPLVTGAFAAVKQATGASNSVLEAAFKLTAKNDAPGVGCEGGLCGAGVPNAAAALAVARTLQEGGLDTIEFALGDNDTCEQTWFTDNFGQALSLCELYKVTFLGGYDLQGTSYQLLEVEAGGDWVDAQVVDTFERPVEYVSGLDVTNKTYGYRLCVDGDCSGDIYEMNADAAQEDNRPASCQ